MLRIRVNGVPREVAHGTVVGQLLDQLAPQRRGVAVAVNGAVVPRAHHDARTLAEGDRVEVVQAVGGG